MRKVNDEQQISNYYSKEENGKKCRKFFGSLKSVGNVNRCYQTKML